jgi:hypothetical protein
VAGYDEVKGVKDVKGAKGVELLRDWEVHLYVLFVHRCG